MASFFYLGFFKGVGVSDTVPSNIILKPAHILVVTCLRKEIRDALIDRHNKSPAIA